MVRITKEPDERRKELIVTARELFYTKGFEHTSVNDIVKAVGVAQGTFYYYFESKTEVLEAVVSEMINEQQAAIKAIVRDEKLSAIPKWKSAVMASNNWKIARKEEAIELTRQARLQENSLLREKFRILAREKISLLFAEIIMQGIDEGVFETEYPEETAEIVIVIGKSIKDVLMDILINPDKYDDRVELARRKFNAVQVAMERVLGAPQNSLQLVNDEMIEMWFGS